VLGQFAEADDESLIRWEWLEQATRLWCEGPSYAEVGEARLVLGIDVARAGADKSVMVVRRGWQVEEITELPKEGDLMKLCGRIVEHLQRLKIYPSVEVPNSRSGHWNLPDVIVQRGLIVIDSVGIGAGVVDRLREIGYTIKAFNGGSRPRKPERYSNARSEVFWKLREALERGAIALPQHDGLFEELGALQWGITSMGQTALEQKDLTKARLGRSPDFADALSMAFVDLAASGPARLEALR